MFLLGEGAVRWKSKKQSIVAALSCEAEYIAAFPATKEAVWLSRLLAGMLGKGKLPPIVLKIDNQGAIATAKGAGINSRNKHIDMRYHFTRDAVGNNQGAVEYVRSNEPAADPLTKPLLREAPVQDLCEDGTSGNGCFRVLGRGSVGPSSMRPSLPRQLRI